MILFVTFIFIVFPIYSIPFSLFASIRDYKNRMIYLIELAIGLAFLAYCWQPEEIYDLYIWQNQAISLSRMTFKQFLEYSGSNAEIINLFVKFIIGKSNNVSLLQLFVVTSGYINIFYILHDSCKNAQINRFGYTITFIYVIVSLLYLNFISGLFYTWALTITALGIYLYYSKNKKMISIILFIVSILIHTSMLFPIIVFVMFLLSKSNINYKSFVIILIICILPNVLLPILSRYTNIAIFNEIYIMYKGYFLLDVYNEMNSGGLMFVNVLMSIPLYLIYFFNKKKVDKLGKLAVLLNIVTWLLYLTAPIFVRYVYLTVLLFMTTFEKYFDSKSENVAQANNKQITFVLICFIEIIIIFYQFYLLKDISIMKIISDNFCKSLLSIFFD